MMRADLPPTRLAFDAVRDAIRHCGWLVSSELAPATDVVVELPVWVASYGVALGRIALRDATPDRGTSPGDVWLLWVEPAEAESIAARGDGPQPASDGAGAFSVSQALLNLPPGRYLVDIVSGARDGEADGAGAVVSRESASASPLVIGLPRRRGPLLVSIATVTR
jgi:hypothetical protein